MKKLLLGSLLLIGGLVHGQSANQLHFDGVNDYVDLDLIAAPLTQTFTIEFWTNYTADENPDYGVIFGVNTSAGGNKFLIRAAGTVDATSDGIVVYIREGATNQYMYGAIPVADGECHHIAFTYNNGECKLYVDGVLDQTATHNFTLSGTDRYSLGQEYDGVTTSNFFKGKIDDVRVWKQTKSIAAINSQKDLELTGFEIGLINYFNVNQGTAGGSNLMETQLNNLANPSAFGALNNFDLNGLASNYLADDCTDNALHFDGDNDFVNLNSISPNMAPLSNFTIEFETNLVSSENPNYSVFFSANTNTGGNRFVIRNHGPADPVGTGVVVFIRAGGVNNYLYGKTPIDDGRCHHVTVVHTGNIFRLYIDGVFDIQDTYPAFSFVANDQFSLGQEYDPGNVPSDFLKGYIDNFRIWNSALSFSTINANLGVEFNAPMPGLLSNFNFNEGISAGNNTMLPFLENTANAMQMGVQTNFTMMSAFSNLVIMPCGGNVAVKKKENRNTVKISDLESTDVTFYNDQYYLTISSEKSLVNAYLIVYNMNGKVCFETEINELTKERIDISGIKPGIYIVQLTDGTNKYNSKFVKM